MRELIPKARSASCQTAMARWLWCGVFISTLGLGSGGLVRADQGVVQGAPVSGETRTPLPDGRILLLGGARATIAARMFDPATGQTLTLAEGLSTARRLQSATLLPSGQVLVLGGQDAAGNIPSAAERFDPGTGHFETVNDLGLLNRTGHSAKVLTDGTVLIVGGRGAKGDAITSAELFDPRTGRIQEVDRQAALDRSGADVQLLTDGRVLITAGREANGARQPTSLVYQTEQQRFVAVRPKDLESLVPVNVVGVQPHRSRSRCRPGHFARAAADRSAGRRYCWDQQCCRRGEG